MDNIKNILIKNLPFWDKLTDAQQELLLQNCHMAHYEKNQTLYASDAECLGVMLVQHGELRVYLLSDEGKEFTLYRLNGGDTCIMSASCILKNINFDVYITSETPCSALIISASAFESIQRNNIHAENYALKLASQKFSNVIWTLEQMLFYKLDKRLAIFLYDEYIKTQSINISLTHEQIAKYIGSAREVVSRALKTLEKKQILTIKNGSLTILNLQELKILTL